MISLIAFSLFAAGVGKSQAAPVWIDAFRHAHPELASQAPLKPSVNAAIHPTAHANSNPLGATGDDMADYRRRLAAALRAGLAVHVHVQQLALAGRYDDAYTSFVSAGLPIWEMHGGDLSLLSACEVLTARQGLAYKQLGGVIGRGTWLPDDSYLNFSIACASRGEVYPGQGKFALAKLEEASQSNSAFWPKGSRAVPQSSRQIEIYSALAMGLGDVVYGPGYMELVLKLDPGNKMAAREAIRFYRSQGRCSDLRRIATQMLRRDNDKSEREYYAAELKKVEGLPDRKQEVRKNPFDNANPPRP